MADICTALTRCSTGEHYSLSISGRTIALHQDDLTPLEPEEIDQFLRLALRARQLNLSTILNRVVVGEEATNVKVYNLLGPGLTVTKNNIGITYVNVLNGLNGERTLVDCTGCTQYRFIATVNFVGTGPFGLRVVRDSDSAIFHAADAIALTGERELDTDWQTLPAGFAGLELLRVQAKSIVATDDPVFRRVTLVVR